MLGHLRLNEIEPQHIKKFLAKLISDGASQTRIRNIYAPLRGLLRTAVEEGLLRFDPTAGVRVSRVHDSYDEDQPQPQIKAYTDLELKALIDQTPPEWQLLIRFLAQTGLRISEATALRWQDINFGTKQIHITRRLYRGKFGPPKTRHGHRTIPLAPDLLALLWNHRKTTEYPTDASPVFPTKTGKHLDYNNLYRRVLAPNQKKAGLTTGAHVLRHTCATNLFKNGFNAKQVQIWMGHHSPAFTLAIYLHLLPNDLPTPPPLITDEDETGNEGPETIAI